MRAIKATTFCLRLTLTIGIIIIIYFNIYINHSSRYDIKAIQNNKNQIKLKKYCRDWHNYEQIYKDSKREGLGENGAAVFLTDKADVELNKRLLKETGFAIVVTDKISVNRSIQDTRHPDCRNYLYPSELPSVSIIIIFYNEVLSVLKRTLHSIVNRTPPELLHEIILVNDLSSDKELYEPLQNYINDNFPTTTIRIKNLKERKGLIVTRLEGAKIATGEVLVFFE